MIGICMVGIVLIVSVPKRSALESSRRELSEHVSFGNGTLWVVEQSSLENRPGGGVIYTVGGCDIHRRMRYKGCVILRVTSYQIYQVSYHTVPV